MWVCVPPPKSSWSAVLWESDIPIDLWLPRECVYVCVHACVSTWCPPSHPFEHPSVAKHIWINSIEFCVTVPPSDDNVNYNTFRAYINGVNMTIGRCEHHWLCFSILMLRHIKWNCVLQVLNLARDSGLKGEKGDPVSESLRVVYQYQWNVWDHFISPDMHAFELYTLLCHETPSPRSLVLTFLSSLSLL